MAEPNTFPSKHLGKAFIEQRFDWLAEASLLRDKTCKQLIHSANADSDPTQPALFATYINGTYGKVYQQAVTKLADRILNVIPDFEAVKDLNIFDLTRDPVPELDDFLAQHADHAAAADVKRLREVFTEFETKFSVPLAHISKAFTNASVLSYASPIMLKGLNPTKLEQAATGMRTLIQSLRGGEQAEATLTGEETFSGPNASEAPPRTPPLGDDMIAVLERLAPQVDALAAQLRKDKGVSAPSPD